MPGTRALRVVVLLALLELISGAYALAVVELVVPGIAAGVVVLVLRREPIAGSSPARGLPGRFWIAAPIAFGTGAVLVVTLALVGTAGTRELAVNLRLGSSGAR